MVYQEEKQLPEEASSTARRMSSVAGTCCSTGVIWCLTAGYRELRNGTIKASGVVGHRRATVTFGLLTDFDVVQVGVSRHLGLHVARDMMFTAPDKYVRVAPPPFSSTTPSPPGLLVVKRSTTRTSTSRRKNSPRGSSETRPCGVRKT